MWSTWKIHKYLTFKPESSVTVLDGPQFVVVTGPFPSVLRIYLFEKNCETFSFLTFTPKQDHWKIHMIFSWSPLEISHCFYLTPENPTSYFFNTPGNTISSTPNLRILFLCSSFVNSSFSFSSLDNHIASHMHKKVRPKLCNIATAMSPSKFNYMRITFIPF